MRFTRNPIESVKMTKDSMATREGDILQRQKQKDEQEISE